VLGFVLMACFFFGSLSVFDREIDRWAIPPSRFAPQPMPSFDRVLEPAFRAIKPDAATLEEALTRNKSPLPAELGLHEWGAYTTHRDPALQIWAGYELPDPKDPDNDHVFAARTIDPRNGAPMPETALKIGSHFFYPMHYSLHLHWMDLGYWIVGMAAMAMLAALVTGVVMHRKIFRELFTFRPNKHTQRSLLDLHNRTGVIALPFHFVFALSGLIIFAGIYFPVSDTLLKPQAKAFQQAEIARSGLPEHAAGVPARLASVDAMVAEAQRLWATRGMAGEVGFLGIHHVDDANATVSIYRADTDRVTLTGEGVHFKGTTGEVIREDEPVTTVRGINDFITGLHLQQFRHWPLRVLYFWADWPAAPASPPASSSSSRSASGSTPSKAAAGRAGSMRWRSRRSPACSARPWPCWSPTACCRWICPRAETGRSASFGQLGCSPWATRCGGPRRC
jgi:uncharacterized iron-regulated membrane protein